MRMTPIQIQALGRFLEPVRPDWDYQGVRANLEKLTESWEVAAWIAIQCAADPTARTPGAMSNPLYRTGEVKLADPTHSAGRSNVIRLRAQMAEADAVKATPEQRAGILAEWRNRTNPTSRKAT